VLVVDYRHRHGFAVMPFNTVDYGVHWVPR
jgi:hypothetical protein